MAALTRRQALLGAGAVTVAAGVGPLGRYALGDEFEEHVAETIGLELPVTRELLETMREEVGDYDARAAAFLVATTGPYKSVVPDSLRRKAVESFIGPLIDVSGTFVTPYVYLARRPNARFLPCSVLRRT